MTILECTEQRELSEPAPASLSQPEAATAEPAAPPPPAVRGRPFVKGQSGNPAGRPPSRARVAAVVAEGMITRKTIPLTNRLIGLALAGDRAALRLCFDRLAPPRQPPVSLQLPSIESHADLREALVAVADAAVNGKITAAQSDALVRMLTTAMRFS